MEKLHWGLGSWRESGRLQGAGCVSLATFLPFPESQFLYLSTSRPGSGEAPCPGPALQPAGTWNAHLRSWLSSHPPLPSSRLLSLPTADPSPGSRGFTFKIQSAFHHFSPSPARASPAPSSLTWALLSPHQSPCFYFYPCCRFAPSQPR